LTVNKSFLSPAGRLIFEASEVQALSGQEEKRPQRKYFFSENGRLLVQVSDFAERLEYQDFLSEGEKISAAFILGEIFGLNRALSSLDNHNKASSFLYNEKNINEYSRLVKALENLYYDMVNKKENDAEDFLFALAMLADWSLDFTSSAIKSIKTKTPF